MPKNATIQLLSRRYWYDWITQIIRNLLLRRPLKALILQLRRQQMEMLMLMKVAHSLTLKEQLEELLKESQSTTKTVQHGQPSDVEKTMTSAIKTEMQLFAITGEGL